MNPELLKKLAIALALVVVPGGLAIGASFAVRRFRKAEPADVLAERNGIILEAA